LERVTHSEGSEMTSLSPLKNRIRESLEAILLIGSALLLLDVSIETFFSDAPFPQVIAIGCLGILVIGVALRLFMPGVWSRIGSFDKATIALLAFLGLVAVVTHLSPQSEPSLRALGQSSDSILAVILLIAVSYSGVLLVREHSLPLGVRAGVVLVGLYSALAFASRVYAANASIIDSYAWLHQWATPAPFVAMLLVFFAFTCEVIRNIQKFNRSSLYRALALGFSMLIAPSQADVRLFQGADGVSTASDLGPDQERPSVGYVRSERGHDREPAIGNSDLVPLSEQPLSAEWDAKRSEIRGMVDWATLDVGALQEELGSELPKVHAFVRDQIAFEPYEGALRGARGTLLFRAGNAIDRALLLRALLDAGEHETRLVEAELSRGEWQSVLSRSLASGPQVDRLSQGVEWLFDAAAADLEAIGDALWEFGFRAPSSESSSQQMVSSMSQHVWVQVRQGETWLDLDPTPGLAVGETLAPPLRTYTAVPDDWHYQLRLRIEVDMESGERLHSQEVLAYETRYADVAGLPIGLFHEREEDQAKVVLLIGDRVARSLPFPAPAEAAPEPPGLALPQGVFGALESLSVNPRQESADATGSSEPKKRLMGERLAIQLYRPGNARSEWSEIVTLADRSEAGSDERFRHDFQGVVGIGATGGPPPAVLAAALLAETPNPLGPSGNIRMLAALEAARATLRAQLPASTLGLPTRRVIDSPQLSILRVRSRGEEQSVEIRINLLRKSYQLVPVDHTLERGNTLFYDYVVNGTADHVVERALLESGTDSVGAMFAAANQQGVGLLVAGTRQEIPSFLPERSKRMVGDALAHGRLIVLPRSPLRGFPAESIGWWEIDGKTGWTEDRHPDGGHQDSVERPTLQVSIVSRSTPTWKQYGCVLYVVLGGAVGQVGDVMIATGNPYGVVLKAAGDMAVYGLGQCGRQRGGSYGMNEIKTTTPEVPPSPFRGFAQNPTASSGFKPKALNRVVKKLWMDKPKLPR
jgi:hypothetical protein